MPEPILNPIPNPEALPPKQLIIGETPVYFKTPQQIDGKTVESFLVLDSDTRASALTGIGTAVILMKEPSRKHGERGMLIDKPLLFANKMDPVEWDKVSGIRYTDANNEMHDISKQKLTLEKESIEKRVSEDGAQNSILETPNDSFETQSSISEPPLDILEAAQKQKESPVLARAVLETLTEDPNTITIVGLKAYEVRARDLAARKMQTLVTPAQKDMSEAQNRVWEKTKDTADWFKNLGHTIWKQSIGGTYFTERARQYYMDMLRASETPFAEEAIKMAESRAKITYDKLLSDKNFIARAGTKAVEWTKDVLGMRTLIQRFALQEIGNMKVAGEIKGIESFDREAKAVRLRFSQDMDKADIFIRRNLGEKLDILNPSDETHKPLVDGIKGLMRDYATGEIADKQTFDERSKEFFKTTLKDARPDVFAEAELYSSSLFDAAETLRAKREHIGGMEAINAELDTMKIRLGIAQMGEVTSLIPSKVESATKKITAIAEWIESKGIPFRPALFNEATIGTGVALASTALKFVQTAPFRALGLGAIAGGTFAGFREYGALQRDYLTHLREREAGDTFGESMKRRNFFEKYLVSQRSAEEMIGKIQTSLYEADGTIKAILTDDELRMGMATITDITARKAVSEAGDKKRIGLIRFSERESIETQRTALDVTSHKALTDIQTYLLTHTEQSATVLGSTTFEEFMVKLTTNQTTVLKDGAQALTNMTEDPVRNVLGLVASYTPEIHILKRRFPLAIAGLPKEQQILGMDAILDQFTRDARAEAVKYGIKAGIVGAGVGAVVHGVGDFMWHKVPDVAGAAAENINERISNIDHPAVFTPDALSPEHVTNPFILSSPSPDHTVTIGEQTYQLPKELDIERIKSGFGGDTTYNARLDFSDEYTKIHDQPDIIFGENLTQEKLIETLNKAGIHLVDAHTAGDIIAPSHSVNIPELFDGNHNPITIKLPPDYYIQKEDGDYAIMFDKHSIVDNIKFNPDGSLAEKLNLPPHLQYDPAQVNQAFEYKGVDDIVSPLSSGEMMTLSGDQLENGSLWDHFLNQVQKTPDENPMASTNGMKNLFRLYEQYTVEHDANGLPENIHSSDIRLRDAVFGGEPVRELDIAHIPSDAQIELPEYVFGADGVQTFQELQKQALLDYQKELLTSKGPMDAVNAMYADPDLKLEAIALKLGYIGDDAHLPTEGDVNLLIQYMKERSASDLGEVPNPLDENPLPIHEVVINKVYEDTIPTSYIGSSDPLEIPYMTAVDTETIANLLADDQRNMDNDTAALNLQSTLPWFPIFIPYRASLEREYIPASEPSTTPIPNSEFLSPFGNEQMYVTKDAMDERKSPRLAENPEAELKTFEEINWYLSTLTDAERQTVLELHAQNDKPMALEVTRVVAIPTVPTQAAQVYQTLSQFTTQTDPTGALLNPKQTEIVVLNRTSAMPVIEGQETLSTPGVDKMKMEIDRFRTDHPEFSVVYLTREYPDTAPIGEHKKDLTNVILHRMETRGETGGDVAIINSNIESSAISSTYLSTISTSLENPATDMVAGSFHLPKEAYSTYPMLFAAMRLQEMFDGMVRQGESSSIPNIISGNTAVKASTLAAIGGYNEKAAIAEDRELAHIIKNARNNRPDAVVENVDLDQTINPKESLYRVLQNLGVADKAISLEQHERYKDKTWQELADKATENFTREHLELSINQLYQQSYPTLKAQNPELFDAYFGHSMDALGLSYEITDGTIHITDDSLLAQNMAAEPTEVVSARQTLEGVAGTTDEQIAENTIEKTSFEPSVSSPAVDESVPNWLSELEEKKGSSISSPEVSAETPDVRSYSTPDVEQKSAPTINVSNETLPEGVTDRINYLIKKHADEGQATVEVTPNELMDYVKSTVSIPNGRITEGSLTIQNDKVRITDIVVQTPIGKAKISGDLIDDPTYGLHLDPNTLDTQLDLLLRTQATKIKENANTLTDKIKTHFNEKITDPNWESSTMHVNGDKISLTFVKKTTTPAL